MTRHRLFAAAAAAALCAAGAAQAQSIAYNASNFINVPGSTSTTLGGVTYINQGLVGTARLPATLHDFNDETLGSFSGMVLDLSTWRRGADGGYSASLYTLPDRGPNNIGGLTTTNYAGRLNKFGLTLNPYTGTVSVPSTTQQATLTPSGGFLLRDTTGQLFTGRDPLTGTLTRDGVVYPTPPAGDIGAGKIALDAEAVAFLADGSFYIGDEYGAAIYYFDSTGRQIGAIQATPDIIPRVNGAINFNGANDSPLVAGSTGRRSNQGMEGVSVSPDGTRLFAVLQSATLQDNPTNVAARRNNTRVLVYDIATSKTPTAPVSEYVLQLPVFNNSATGTGNATTTAAQSEILALNNTQFLVLSRDGNGRGTNGNANAIAFKSILLVDVTGATNITGTSFAGTTPVSTSAAANGSGALAAGITPVQQVELVNMLNTAQLSRFGVNTVTAPSTQYTLSEKWEAMALAPVLEEARPNDFFLLVGNDNDFVSNDIDAAGITNANAALSSATAGVGNNDNVILFYRLTIPTYIDPQALNVLKTAGAASVSGAQVVGSRLGSAATLAGLANANTVRRARFTGVDVSGARAWAQGGYEGVGVGRLGGRVNAASFAAGADAGDNNLRYGLSIAGSDYGGGAGIFDFDGNSYGAGAYAAWFGDAGVYLQGGAGLSHVKVRTTRPGAYAQVANGSTSGHAVSVDVQGGYAAGIGGGKIGPYVDVLYSHLSLDGYVESGASVSNGRIPKTNYGRMEATLGVEAAFGSAGAVRPSLRVGYTLVDESGDRLVNLALAAVSNSAFSVRLPSADKNFVSGEVALEGEWNGFGWRASAGARGTQGDTSGYASLGFAKAF
jgi:uncharacterized protein YhjY with autotransporter beta-barrel domain